MLKKILKNYQIIIFIIYILLSLAPFLWFSFQIFKNYPYAGGADFISPINIKNDFFNRLFIYSPLRYGGTETGFTIASLFPENSLTFFMQLMEKVQEHL